MKERVVVFGDAIIAIILTIIVLELPIQTAANGTVDIVVLFRAIGIYFISFCFVANLWFQTGYAFNKIEQVKNRDLVIYLLLLFFLSLDPSATRLLIEDTTKQTLLIYGVLTLIVTVVMRRLITALTKQVLDDNQRELRIKLLNKQDGLSVIFRVVVLIFGLFFIRPTLIIYLVLPIMAFLQNMVEREENDLIASLDSQQQADYFQDRNQVWGNSMRRYSALLRDSMKDGRAYDSDRWKKIMADWEEYINGEINERKRLLPSLNENETRRVKNEIARLEKQRQRMEMQKSLTEEQPNHPKPLKKQHLKQRRPRK
ncbi:TMEM175 family protein [Enterococcus dongliensis]|uniref:TMEM175 family protein n=1 Tax=Enterococcus dongliensis TaxID=2559925 RepID=A0AAW8THG6_9ENTE|nr:TMEM175 family protein [Enterococcus dongliensis]MDT2596906.1 TMEM175 family protein [Enterococcus dongliensis]MDT2604538.1 TMEM175 family protein [Enterococcus dongliensis]MDT2634692.1 TMEM175 family protein [Enterococcus dongliensis]MDT2637744.1 TMEM175 family protein [Enterococcus dongliensis]MDT2642815.1 TMEM175 family protein [Enterococcus dongliensis]